MPSPKERPLSAPCPSRGQFSFGNNLSVEGFIHSKRPVPLKKRGHMTIIDFSKRLKMDLKRGRDLQTYTTAADGILVEWRPIPIKEILEDPQVNVALRRLRDFL